MICIDVSVCISFHPCVCVSICKHISGTARPIFTIFFVSVRPTSSHGSVAIWYGMVNVDLYSSVITKVSNALNMLVSGEKSGFQTLSKGLVVLLCYVYYWFYG